MEKPKIDPEEMQLFPVPTDNVITIKIPGLHKPVRIDIIDTSGKKAYQTDLFDEELVIDLGKILAPGLYYVRTTDGSKKLNRKILIK